MNRIILRSAHYASKERNLAGVLLLWFYESHKPVDWPTCCETSIGDGVLHVSLECNGISVFDDGYHGTGREQQDKAWRHGIVKAHTERFNKTNE